jgi:hypothetical protein
VDAEELYVKTLEQSVLRHRGARGRRLGRPAHRARCGARPDEQARRSRTGRARRCVVPPRVDIWVLDHVLGDEVWHVDAGLAARHAAQRGRTSFRHETRSAGGRAVDRSASARSCSIVRYSRRFAIRRQELSPTSHSSRTRADAAGDAGQRSEYAAAAGARAASRGSHRGPLRSTARAALRRRPAAGRARRLLALYAQECYFTNQIDAAVAAHRRALSATASSATAAGRPWRYLPWRR